MVGKIPAIRVFKVHSFWLCARSQNFGQPTYEGSLSRDLRSSQRACSPADMDSALLAAIGAIRIVETEQLGKPGSGIAATTLTLGDIERAGGCDPTSFTEAVSFSDSSMNLAPGRTSRCFVLTRTAEGNVVVAIFAAISRLGRKTAKSRNASQINGRKGGRRSKKPPIP